MEESITKYGVKWPEGFSALGIELSCIRKGGTWEDKGKQFGMGLFHHYREAQSLCWPNEVHNRWSDLALKTIIESEITILMGCSDSQKTSAMAKFMLLDYWAFPKDTLWLISSTDYRGAEGRIFGRAKDLFNEAKAAYPALAGRALESKYCITTDIIDEAGIAARSLTRGILLVPLRRGGMKQSMSALVGYKAPRLRHAGDEISMASVEFLDAYINWYGKEDFKGLMAGHPLDTTDPLCIAGEPVEGWEGFVDDGKTQTWKSKWFNASVIAFDGRDSPNFEFPIGANGKVKYPFIIGPKKLNAVGDTYGRESWQFYQQCIGKPMPGADVWRVITKRMCEEHHAFDEVNWDGATTKIYGLDPAYGGEDRCVGTLAEYGTEAITGKQVIKFGLPEIIPINPASRLEPEEQIAFYVNNRLRELNIDPSHCFYDSFGRGTLGFAFARMMGANCPVPVDSGAKPTRRPVRFDLFVTEPDGRKRHKRCDEHYSKWITEGWMSVRQTIESEQMRELPMETAREFWLRKYEIVLGNKEELEPKDELKKRTNRSPDLADSAVFCLEGARQRGFKIKRSGEGIETKKKDDWLTKQVELQIEFNQSRQLLRA